MANGEPLSRSTVPIAVVPHEAREAMELRASWMPVMLVGFGLTMFAAATVLLAVWGGDLAAPSGYGTYRMLGLTHMVTLGFVTSLIIAVTYQFIAASFHANVHGRSRAHTMAVGYVAAVTLFVVALVTGSTLWDAIGGPLLGLVIAIFLSQMASVVIRARRRSLEGAFHVAAFTALAIVIVLGSLLATSLGNGWLGDPRRLLTLKILLAVGGWVGCALIGVSYNLLRGLNGSSRRPRMLTMAVPLVVGGLTLAAVAIALAWPAWIITAALAITTVGTVAFLVDAIHLVRGRSHRAVTATWAGQLVAGALLSTAAAAATLAPIAGLRLVAVAVTTVLLGAAPVAIVANGNRIVPVLIANRHRGAGIEPLSARAIGRWAVPGAEGLIVVSWIALEAGIATGAPGLIRMAGLVDLIAAGGFGACAARHLWAGRRVAATHAHIPARPGA